MKQITETGFIRNVREYLANTDADVVVVAKSHVHAGWYEVESDAYSAGFNVYRPYLSECYKFVRK